MERQVRGVKKTTRLTMSKTGRQRLVTEAIHSGEMEGLRVTAAGKADAGEYVAGRIDSDELVARARARYGLG